MSIKNDVIEIHLKHPDWHSDMIAQFLGVMPETVRGIGSKARITFPPKNALTVKRQFKKARYAGWAGDSRW